jgi:hypothetical protein
LPLLKDVRTEIRTGRGPLDNGDDQPLTTAERVICDVFTTPPNGRRTPDGPSDHVLIRAGRAWNDAVRTASASVRPLPPRRRTAAAAWQAERFATTGRTGEIQPAGNRPVGACLSAKENQRVGPPPAGAPQTAKAPRTHYGRAGTALVTALVTAEPEPVSSASSSG